MIAIDGESNNESSEQSNSKQDADDHKDHCDQSPVTRSQVSHRKTYDFDAIRHV